MDLKMMNYPYGGFSPKISCMKSIIDYIIGDEDEGISSQMIDEDDIREISERSSDNGNGLWQCVMLTPLLECALADLSDIFPSGSFTGEEKNTMIKDLSNRFIKRLSKYAHGRTLKTKVKNEATSILMTRWE